MFLQRLQGVIRQIFSMHVIILVLSLVIKTLCEKEKALVTEFDVKPGGVEQTFSESWKGITCQFTYTCQGGTKENWQLKIGKLPNSKKYFCTAERPDGNSYLYFQQVSMKIQNKAAKVEDAHGEKSGGEPLNEDELALDIASKSVQQSDSFQSALSKLSLIFTKASKKSKKEL